MTPLEYARNIQGAPVSTMDATGMPMMYSLVSVEMIETAIVAAIAEEREAVAKLGDERAAQHKRRRLAYPDEESWWQARMCEARDYAATIRALP